MKNITEEKIKEANEWAILEKSTRQQNLFLEVKKTFLSLLDRSVKGFDNILSYLILLDGSELNEKEELNTIFKTSVTTRS